MANRRILNIPVNSRTYLDWYREANIGLSYAKSLEEVLSWPDYLLEETHDYIQWLFPLPEHSAYVAGVPVVDPHIYGSFRSESRLRENLEAALHRMARFYGFSPSADGTRFLHNFRRAHDAKWIRPHDHNHQRMTRIIRSLRILGLPHHAQAFYDAICSVEGTFPGIIAPMTIVYWNRAMTRPLTWVPDDNDENGPSGPAWLEPPNGVAK